MGIDECLRVNLELPFRFGMDVSRRFRPFDTILLPEQQAAALARRSTQGFRKQRFDYSA